MSPKSLIDFFIIISPYGFWQVRRVSPMQHFWANPARLCEQADGAKFYTNYRAEFSACEPPIIQSSKYYKIILQKTKTESKIFI
ncbi:hypothetical protein DBY21_04055 [Candidatus Gastranaerophilales bacterium]|nr:MAG: hypothetical protein DBY21_04055 [Candidatus Gastranaerophilales bacterium]